MSAPANGNGVIVKVVTALGGLIAIIATAVALAGQMVDSKLTPLQIEIASLKDRAIASERERGRLMDQLAVIERGFAAEEAKNAQKLREVETQFAYTNQFLGLLWREAFDADLPALRLPNITP